MQLESKPADSSAVMEVTVAPVVVVSGPTELEVALAASVALSVSIAASAAAAMAAVAAACATSAALTRYSTVGCRL